MIGTENENGVDKLMSRLRNFFSSVTMIGIAVFFLVLVLLRFLVGVPESEEPSPSVRIEPAVVHVVGFDENGEERTSGSGVLVFTDRTVVTALSNVDYCVSAVIYTHTGAQYNVSRVLSAENGIALLKLSESTERDVLPVHTDGTTDAPLTLWAFDGETLTELNVEADALPDGTTEGSALTDATGSVTGVVADGTVVSAASIYDSYIAATQEQTLRALCNTLHPGYFTYRKATSVDYAQLLADPESYDGQRIALSGYAAYAEEYSASARDSELYLLPSAEEKTWTGEPVVAPDGHTYTAGYMPYWCFTPFDESKMVRCYDGTHTVKTQKYTDGKVTVCGKFHYADGVASLELEYTGEVDQ